VSGLEQVAGSVVVRVVAVKMGDQHTRFESLLEA
jgi:hypothetical protein